ncbi:DUF1652 domain-containing protein [Pseudomonas sp. IPO3749]|uniref:Uncharacterized protein n=1 Tax=Pseudomonas fluorescens LMG 5329 TaxID=1324332 RepID=A0A0A1Z3N1_PSEFL|nr:hypothetical protein K814_0106350 [Pseudomonas fluorescens LMG 5329]NWE05014.1 DUF1652 domain-containing protein [Pseudomonas sp. IPO3749]NWF24614.1 DUF1652 domain-containing protein [Pseudomonas sp. IPO3749]
MPLYGLSILEMRHLIECTFLPIRCKCTLAGTGSPALSIQIISLVDNCTELLIAIIDINSLNTSRDIANLVAEIKYELHNKTPLHPILTSLSKQRSHL